MWQMDEQTHSNTSLVHRGSARRPLFTPREIVLHKKRAADLGACRFTADECDVLLSDRGREDRARSGSEIDVLVGAARQRGVDESGASGGRAKVRVVRSWAVGVRAGPDGHVVERRAGGAVEADLQAGRTGP